MSMISLSLGKFLKMHTSMPHSAATNLVNMLHLYQRWKRKFPNADSDPYVVGILFTFLLNQTITLFIRLYNKGKGMEVNPSFHLNMDVGRFNYLSL